MQQQPPPPPPQQQQQHVNLMPPSYGFQHFGHGGADVSSHLPDKVEAWEHHDKHVSVQHKQLELSPKIIFFSAFCIYSSPGQTTPPTGQIDAPAKRMQPPVNGHRADMLQRSRSDRIASDLILSD